LFILQQSLSALKYLHEHKPSIVHRDIKPENILVQSRDPLHVKLADFGLAKASSYLNTICGTGTYLAPEIAKYCGLSKSVPKEKYTVEVDIWSLGVVVLKYGYGLPFPGKGGGIEWCDEIVKAVNDWDSEDLIDLLATAMLVTEAKSRHSATRCLDKALKLSVSSGSRCLTPTPDFFAHERQRSVVESSADSRQGGLDADPASQSPQQEDLNPESQIRNYVRSDAPPPDACSIMFPQTRKRSTRPSASSSGGRLTKRHEKAPPASSSNRPRHEKSIAEPVAVPDRSSQLLRNDQHLAHDATLANAAVQDEGNDDRDSLTDSEVYMAARLLQAIHDEGCL
jgi:serine/threonine protein kinase